MLINQKQLLTIGIALIAFPIFASASTSVGTIDSTYKYARICHDTTCTTYGNFNGLPSINGSTAGAVPVSITDSGITGYGWGDEIGWINFNPTGGGVSVNATTGVLTGYAWANGGSWINFNPTQVSGGPAVGVSIDSNGQFTGWAWVSGQYGGWMRFDCSSAATCVKTDWRPLAQRPTTTPPGGGGGNGPIVVNPTPTPTPNGGSATTTPKGIPVVPAQNPPVPANPPTSHEIPPSNHGGNTKPVTSTTNPTGVNQFQNGTNGGKTNPILPPPSNGAVISSAQPIGVSVGAQQNQANGDGEYRQIFPSSESVFVSHPSCILCIIVRKDPVLVNQNHRNILKWAFVPKTFEIPVHIPFVSLANQTSATHIDVTSIVLTTLAGWLLWKIVVVVAAVLVI